MEDNNLVKFSFFDDFWLKGKSGTVRRWFEPRYFSEFCDPSFGGMNYNSLIPDKERGTYRLYYVGFDPENEKDCFIALAETSDLQSFEPVKIKQGNERYPAHVLDIKDRGVPASEYGATGVVIHDDFDHDPSRRYKLMCYMMEQPGVQSKDLQVAFSADGLHWELQHDMVATSSNSDTLNKLFYNPYTKEYSLIHRATHIDRRIALKSTKDFKSWTRPKIIMHPGSRFNSDDSITELYGMTAEWHDGIFLGITWPFHMKFYESAHSNMNGYIESELVYSYDGEHFMDTTSRQLVERPHPPLQGSAQISFTNICESLDGTEYVLAARGFNVHHSKVQPEMVELQNGRAFGAVFYRIRKDGFCGIEGSGAGAPGFVLTKGVQLLKDDLTFNVNASSGIARFGIMKDTDRPAGDDQRPPINANVDFYDGFSFDDCVQFRQNDSVDIVPQWKDHELQELVGKRVYIAVELKFAILHAMTVTARPQFRSDAEPSRGFWDPEQMVDV